MANESTDGGPFLGMVGGVSEGFSLHGPFADVDDADDAVSPLQDERCAATRAVVTLIAPQQWVKDTVGEGGHGIEDVERCDPCVMPTEGGSHVIFAGDLLSGFVFIGPFVEYNDAQWVAENFVDGFYLAEITK